jgi:hypothetical protein
MSVVVSIISTRTGFHVLQIGMDSNSLADFRIQCWVTRYGARLVDCVQAMSLNFISFMGGDIWVHNDDTAGTRCNLFGEKRDCIVGVVTNENPLEIKLLNSIGVHSDQTWEITSITIPPTLNHPQGMASAIPKEQFKRRGGIWRAKFLRNLKSALDSVTLLDAIQGEQLSGAEAYIVLKNTSTNQVKLFEISVEMTTSRV